MKILTLFIMLFSGFAFAEIDESNCRTEMREYAKARRTVEKSMNETFRWYERAVEGYEDIAVSLRAGVRIGYNFAVTAKNNANTFRRNYNLELNGHEKTMDLEFKAFLKLEDCLLGHN
ncbi:MAG: hypothetical protein CME64_17015 [Halobacteriovoraceae bacterium]|nr:hypothetical protein [Halobacteriovoraceae bacterium]|tara:strand:- start:108605 stop:108958 length:354 start_codon:yes stop_codon:yes gene_type:complete